AAKVRYIEFALPRREKQARPAKAANILKNPRGVPPQRRADRAADRKDIRTQTGYVKCEIGAERVSVDRRANHIDGGPVGDNLRHATDEKVEQPIALAPRGRHLRISRIGGWTESEITETARRSVAGFAVNARNADDHSWRHARP